MGSKSKLDLRRQKAANKAARGSKELTFTSTTKTSIPKTPETATKVIPGGFKFGTASLTRQTKNYDDLIKKFIDEYKLLVSGKKKGLGSRRDVQDRRTQVFSIDKNIVIKPLVNHQMKLVKERFGNRISEKELIDSVYNVLKEKLLKITKSVGTKATITWQGDEFTVDGPGNNFKVIQSIITQLKKELLVYSFDLINNTKRKLSREESIGAASAFAITGTDVKLGEDITRKQLVDADPRDGNFILDTTKLEGNRLSKLAKGRGSGLQIGHTFGPGLGNITAFTGTPEVESELLNLFSPEAKSLLLEIRQKAIEIDASYEVDVALTKKSGRDIGTVSITIAEGTGPNQLSGANLRPYVEAVRQIVKKEFAAIISEYELSAPILNQIVARTALVFLEDDKPKPIKSRGKGSRKTKVNVPTPVYKLDLQQGSRTRGRGKAKSDNVAPDLKLLIQAINDRLHDKIQENMGKGRSKEILNYRTGRFARSAKVETLFEVKEKGAIGAQVKYMRYPYGVFEPGGRLHKPGRDPHRIFGRSIRQILQEQQLAKLRRVKVNLNG